MFLKIKLLLCFLSIGFLAISQGNSLVVVSSNGNPFYLSIGREQINKTLQSNVKAFDVVIGWNLIEIKMPMNDKELLLTDSVLIISSSKLMNKEFTYALVENENKLKFQFKAVSELSGPKSLVIPEVPKEVVPLVDNSVYGNLYKAVNNKPVFFVNYVKDSAICKLVLSSVEIDDAIKLVQKYGSTELAYRYLEQIILLNCYSTSQLKQLLELMPVDVDRLSLAKLSYAHITDVQNCSSLFSIFKSNAMKESFVGFMKEQDDVSKQHALNCKVPANESIFVDVFNKIKNIGDEYERLQLSKKILGNVCFDSNQIKKIMELFSHDREKLEFVKYALPILTDKDNKKLLADEFQFSGTKDEFLKYLNQ